MKQVNTIGVDLAKNVIQISIVSPSNKELSNKSLSRKKFAEFLAKQEPSLIAFEACSSAHYWARKAKSLGHQAILLPAKAVAPFRQGHKTDENDALAVAEAAKRPNIKKAPIKNTEQQALQSIQRSREHLIQDRTASSNHIRGLLMEFGCFIPKGFAHIRKQVPEILEDGENELPYMLRSAISRMFKRFQRLEKDIAAFDKQIQQIIKSSECEKLTKLEGVGPIGAILMYASFGDGKAFTNGRNFSAYLGVAPKQYSSGGRANIIGISKYFGNRKLKAVLIQGALAYINHMKKRKQHTGKDKWLLSLLDRAGSMRTAVALANKNARTAWAILTNGTDYDIQHQSVVAA